MSAFEFLGYALVIFLACVGAYVIGRLVYEGLKATTGALAIGNMHTDAGVRDHLERMIR